LKNSQRLGVSVQICSNSVEDFYFAQPMVLKYSKKKQILEVSCVKLSFECALHEDVAE